MKLSLLGKKYFQANTLLIFIIIYAIYAISLTIEFKFIFTDEFYFNALDNGLNSSEKIISFINKDRESEWVNYPLTLLVILVPTLAISFVLYLGAIVTDIKLSLKDSFKITLKSQIVFAISYLIVVILKWQNVIDKSIRNINDRFSFQSILIFFDKEKIPEWLQYPMQCLNITELIGILFLAYGFSIITRKKYFRALGQVTLFYTLGLLFWIVAVEFIQIVLL